MKAEKVDHICIAVRGLEVARRVYEESPGLDPALEYAADSEKIHMTGYYYWRGGRVHR